MVLGLAEGSAQPKLGENAAMKVNALGKREGRVFWRRWMWHRGVSLHTNALRNHAGQGAVNVRVASITAGVFAAPICGQFGSRTTDLSD